MDYSVFCAKKQGANQNVILILGKAEGKKFDKQCPENYNRVMCEKEEQFPV